MKRTMLRLSVVAALACAPAAYGQSQIDEGPGDDVFIDMGDGVRIVLKPDGTWSVEGENAGAIGEIEADLQSLVDQGARGQSAPNEEIWDGEPGQAVRHIPSGAVCPLLWGGLLRREVITYASNGADVACDYVDLPWSARLRLYIYRNPLPIERELPLVLDAMRDAAVDADQAAAIEAMREAGLDDVPFSPPTLEAVAFNGADETLTARAFAYADGDGSARRSSVLLADAGGWRLKIRLACLESEADGLERAAAERLLDLVEMIEAAADG